MKRRVSLGAGTVAGFALLLALLYVSVALFTFDVRNYPEEPPFDAMSKALVGYLRGDIASLSEPFTDQESLHMIDVLALFRSARTMAFACGTIGIMLCFVSLLRGDRARFATGLRIGMGLFAGLIAACGVWALMDFNGWFTAMHRVAFTNDLWLFDPDESLLIQMLPLSFFMGAVRRITVNFGLFSIALLLFSIGIQKISVRGVKS